VSRNEAEAANVAHGATQDGSRGLEESVMQLNTSSGTTHASRHWPLLGELFCADADRDWDWEGIRVGNKLHLYCYLRDVVVALAPFELEA
jgi:hypothetical protein